MSNGDCPVTKRPCVRDCKFSYEPGDGSIDMNCQLLALKRAFPPVLVGNSYFISAQHLGAIEGVVVTMLANGLKRSRRIEFNHIQQVLKKLKLIPPATKVIALGMGTLDTGDAGLIVLCSSPHQIQADIPTYAEERSKP